MNNYRCLTHSSYLSRDMTPSRDRGTAVWSSSSTITAHMAIMIVKIYMKLISINKHIYASKWEDSEMSSRLPSLMWYDGSVFVSLYSHSGTFEHLMRKIWYIFIDISSFFFLKISTKVPLYTIFKKKIILQNE
jgi:hypothetical protein